MANEMAGDKLDSLCKTKRGSADSGSEKLLTEECIKMEECAGKVEPNNEELAEIKKSEANSLYAAKHYKLALVGYTEAIDLCPYIARYYSNRAACYMMLYQYKNALSDAKKCVELDHNFLKAYPRIIKCSLILGDIVGAETTLNKLSELDPQNPILISEKKDLVYVQKYFKEAEAAYNLEDFRKVVYCMDRCCDISTACSKFKLIKAECLAFLGRYQDAQEIANNVLHIDKTNAEAIYIRGMCLYFQDHVDRAFGHFIEVLRLAPDHKKALNIYKRAKCLKKKKEDGNAAFKAEQYQRAYDLYTEALAIDPKNIMTNAKLHYNKALVAAKLGKLKEGVSECTEALKLDENYIKAILKRASCYMDLQEYEEAVRDYEKAFKLDKSRDNKRLLNEAKQALKRSQRKDYYKILGIDKNATTDDIKKAYRKRAMVYHPDRHANASEGEKKEHEKKFKEVGEAYGILSDPKKRSRYDSGHDLNDIYSDIDPSSMFQAFYGPHGGFQFQTSNFPGGFSFQFE